MKKVFLVMVSCLLISYSCKEKVKAPKTVAPKTVAPKTVAPKTVAPKTVAPKTVAPIIQFKYPKHELFQGFFSGMNTKEFHKHAKTLVDSNILGKFIRSTTGNNLSIQYSYDISQFVTLPKEVVMEGGFLRINNEDYLVYIKLKDISTLSLYYSDKYDLPRFPPSGGYKEGSKIGTYNRLYNPKSYLDITEWNGTVYETKERVKMPDKMIDKSRELDILQKQVYYDNNIQNDQLKPFEKLIKKDSILVMYYHKYWERSESTIYSISESSNFDIPFKIRYYQQIEEQSKQKITTITFYRDIDITYTTKQYYNENIKKDDPKPEQPTISNTVRDVNDEI